MSMETFSDVLGGEAVLSPSDVSSKQFRRALARGYRPQEVDAYLQRVADVMEALLEKARELKSEQEEMRSQLDEYRQMEETFRNALVTSQRHSESLLETARREADAIVEGARVEKERMQVEMLKIPVTLRDEITELKDLRNHLRAGLVSFLETQKSMLDAIIPAEKQPAEPQSAEPAQPHKVVPVAETGSVFPPLGIKEETEEDHGE